MLANEIPNSNTSNDSHGTHPNGMTANGNTNITSTHQNIGRQIPHHGPAALRLEHWTLRQVAKRTMDIFVDRFDVFMTITAIVTIPSSVVLLCLAIGINIEETQNSVGNDSEGNGGGNEFLSSLHKHIRGIFTVYVLQLIIYVLFHLVGEGAMLRATAEALATFTEQPPQQQQQVSPSPTLPLLGWFGCLKAGFRKLGSLLGTAILVGGVIYGGAFVVAFIVYGFGIWSFIPLGTLYLFGVGWWWARCGLSYAPIIVEAQTGPFAAIHRSAELSAGRRLYVLCPLVLLYLAYMLVGALFHNLLNPSDHVLRSLTPTGLMLAILPNLLYLPLQSILKMVLYVSLRVDKEGLTPAILEGELRLGVDAADRNRSVLVDPFFTNVASRDYRQVSLLEEDDDNLSPHHPRKEDMIASSLVA